MTNSEIENRETKENSTISEQTQPIGAVQIIKMVINFLQLFMCETLAKRLASLVLIAAGLPNAKVSELTGVCDRSVRTIKKSIENGNIDGLFEVGGGGRKRKLEDIEGNIVEELAKNNYHSRQQIADMVQEKYGVKVSLSAIGRLLKKTASSI